MYIICIVLYIIARTVLPRVLIFHRRRRRRGVSAAATYKTDPGTTAPFSPLLRFGGKHADVRTLHGSARRGGCGLTAPDGRRRREGTTERNERRRQIEFTEPFPPRSYG